MNIYYSAILIVCFSLWNTCVIHAAAYDSRQYGSDGLRLLNSEELTNLLFEKYPNNTLPNLSMHSLEGTPIGELRKFTRIDFGFFRNS